MSQLSGDQQTALDIITKRYRDKEDHTCIAGLAGCGKSFLSRIVPTALNLANDQVCYAAYTGKATQVLANMGCDNVLTTHKLLYDFQRLKDGTWVSIPKDNLGELMLVIIDEISMLPDDMLQLLMSHKIHVIAFGDPFQLPPVKGETHNWLQHAHYTMTKIIRQEEGNEIIQFAHAVRNNEKLPNNYMGEQVQIIPKSELSMGMLTWADQVICGYNATRRDINVKMSLNKNGLPASGDKVICCQNYWKILSKEEIPLINGTIGTINEVTFSKNADLGQSIFGHFTPDYSDTPFPVRLRLDYKMFMEGVPTINNNNWRKINKVLHPKVFDFGYCITCHKSQGSTFNTALVINEAFGEDFEQRNRWLYTAMTRPKEKLVILN